MMNKLFFPMLFGIYLIPLSINGAQSPLAIRSDLVAIAKAQKTQQLISPTHNLKRTLPKKASLFSAELRQHLGTNPKLGLKTIENLHYRRFGRGRALSDPTVSAHPKKPLLSDRPLIKPSERTPNQKKLEEWLLKQIQKKQLKNLERARIAKEFTSTRFTTWVVQTISDYLHPRYNLTVRVDGPANISHVSPKEDGLRENTIALVEIAGVPMIFFPSLGRIEQAEPIMLKNPHQKNHQLSKQVFNIADEGVVAVKGNHFHNDRHHVSVEEEENGKSLIHVISHNTRDQQIGKLVLDSVLKKVP